MNVVPVVSPRAEVSGASNLVAHVTAARVSAEVADSLGRFCRFQIVGFTRELASAAALTIAEQVRGALVRVHYTLSDGSLPQTMLTAENLTYFRAMRRPEGVQAIVFAVPTAQLDFVGPTAAEIRQLSERSLLDQPDLWTEACENLPSLNNRQKAQLASVFRGIVASGILVGGLGMFARFVCTLDRNFRTIPVERALDEALPELRIPRGSGRFKEFSVRGPIRPPDKWADVFREIHSQSDDALHLRNDRGSPLDRAGLRQKIVQLLADARVSEAEARILANLVDDDRIEPGKWRPSQDEVVHLKWEVVELLVKTTKREKVGPLGEATLAFFEKRMPNELSAQDRKVLEASISGTEDSDDEERDFFFRHRENLKEDARLLRRWERYVFRKTEQHSDLALGLFIAIADLIESAETLPSAPRVFVRLQDAEKKSYWEKHNAELCRFLRDRYRGLSAVFEASGVICDFGMCWSAAWDDGDNGSVKTSAASRQFKFDIFLLSADEMRDGRPSAEALRKAEHTTQLVWSMPSSSFASSYTANMLEVANLQDELAVLCGGRFSRAQASDHLADDRIDLTERGSVQDVFGRAEGALTDTNDVSLDVGRQFQDGLARLRVSGALGQAAADAISCSFAQFHAAYTEAVRAMVNAEGKGLASPAHFQQARAFGELLTELRRLARNDDCRATLWKPALYLGTALAEDLPHAAICTPWHPFRLAEAAAKAKHIAAALDRIISADAVSWDVRTFARSAASSVTGGWHPTVAVYPDTPRPRLLAETENFADFGLMEAPTADQGADQSFEANAKQATYELLNVAGEYLELQPHERSNFTVTLYNSDNRDLPARVADRLARIVESEKDLRCDLILTHAEQSRLRQIYAEQNVAISQELDGVLANEAAQGFLSRLRVGFLDVEDFGLSSGGPNAADLVFLHDVIARSAQTSWRRVGDPGGGWPSFETHVPECETRRRYSEIGTRKTEVLLVPPGRPEEVQAYLDLVRDYHEDNHDAPEGHFVPVREISFDDCGVGAVINEAHQIGRWVVTYDAIADLQLFRSNGVEIIRFLTKPGSDHNLVVSTRNPGAMLIGKLAEAVGPILDEPANAADRIASTCVREAARISGRVVLRAARLENNALELLGLVLSKRVISNSVPEGSILVSWLLLDDFADWLGHRGQKADLLAASVGEEDGIPVLDLIVVESKFVGRADEATAMTKSLAQMRATTNDLRDRIVRHDDALNRQIWLGRVADLLLEHGSFPSAAAGRLAQEWAHLIRSDEVFARIRGVSLVFVHDRTDSRPDPLPSASPEQAQVTFDRSQIAIILREIRSDVGPSTKIRLPQPATAASPAEERGASRWQAVPAVAALDSQKPPTASADSPRPTGETSGSIAALLHMLPTNDVSPDQETAAGSYLPNVAAFLQANARIESENTAGEWLEATKMRLRVALRGYSLDADIVGARLTPNAALIRFRGTDCMTVAEVEKRREVLLTSHGLDVIAIRPEKGEVVVSIGRDQRAILDFCAAWRRRALPPGSQHSNTSFLLGEREMDGGLLYLNLGGPFGGQPQHGPHTLIAGETGGGKGVLTRSVILDICATNSPRQARVRMVDPKSGGDYPWIESMPHLDGGLVKTQEEAIETLKELVSTMEQRYADITRIAPNIDRYNQKVPPEQRLPRIYFFHDELGDWMADKDNAEYRQAVESYVVRLASKARAAGIHLFLITQRPDKDALPGQIKANMNNKVCLRVSSQVNSRIVLDESGAENLLGHGHFAAKLANERPSNQTSLIFAQSPYLDDDLAHELAEAITSHWRG
jgi:DNA segregation ATPase FtsK/SpoIIIE, S-DNA-T family